MGGPEPGGLGPHPSISRKPAAVTPQGLAAAPAQSTSGGCRPLSSCPRREGTATSTSSDGQETECLMAGG